MNHTNVAMPIQPSTMPAIASPSPVCLPPEAMIWFRAVWPNTRARTEPSHHSQTDKWVAIAAVAAVSFVYFAHSHAASAAKVAACLTHAGATVKHSTFLEDSLTAAGDGQQVPSGYVSLLRKAEKDFYNVDLSGDTGLLTVVRKGYTAAQLERYFQLSGQPISVQGSGQIVMLWYGEPSVGSTSRLDGCLP